MKTTLSKLDYSRPAFATVDGRKLTANLGTTTGKSLNNRGVALPLKLTPGSDYAIYSKDGKFRAIKLSALPKKTALGGFHVGLDGLIAMHSIWDIYFRPACADPRAMVFVPAVGWVDIYLTNTDPGKFGTSSPGKQIADGSSLPIMPDGTTAERFSWWVASYLLEHHGKQLLSRREFEIAMEGVTEKHTCGTDPVTTGHHKGLKSRFGIEQATGCMWTWSRSIYDVSAPYVHVLGGSWNSYVAGPRRWNYYPPGDYWDNIGARGRCDHLTPVGSEAKA